MGNYIYTLILFFLLFIVLPLYAILRKKIKQDHKSLYAVMIKFSILFLILRKVLPEHSYSFAQLFNLSWVFEGRKILIILFSVMAILALDALSFYLLLKKIKKGYLLQKKILFFENIIFSSNSILNKIAIVLFCILTGIWEEVIFRGLLYHILGQLGMSLMAILGVSSLLFGIYHIATGVNQMLYSFFFGLIFGTIYILSGYLLIAVIAAHVFGNLVVLLISIPILRRQRDKYLFF